MKIIKFMKSIGVFCGSNGGERGQFAIATRELAHELNNQNLTLVYGGAAVGLMGVLADAMLEMGGKVIGVIPASLFSKEIPHSNLTELHVVDSMHERKQMMYDLSDAFIALPGGLGTLDELCEVLTWGQLGLHKKPCGILNIEGYFDPLLDFFDKAIEKKFMGPDQRRLILVDETPQGLLNQFEGYSPPPLKKWIRAGET